MHCPNCGKSLLVNETTCTRCGRVVLIPNTADSVPWEPWRRWVPMLGVLAFAAAAVGIVLAVKPFIASGKNDRIRVTLPTLAPLRAQTPFGASTAGPAGSGVTTRAAAGSNGSAAGSSTASSATEALTPLGSNPIPPGSTVAPTTSPPPPTAALVPAGPLGITGATATCTAPASTDSRGNPTLFDATNTIDGRDSTAWRCPGDSTGQSLTFTFAAPVQITSVGAEPGYNRIDQFNGDDRWVQNRRVTSATWTCVSPSGTAAGTLSQTFQDARQVQNTATQGGFDKCASLTLTITGVSPAGVRDFTAISEVAAAGRPAA